MENIKIKHVEDKDFEWAIANRFNINLSELKVGEIVLWTFNKESIIQNIEDDYAFYMDEDTHMHERTANFILENIKDRNCVYIESILIDENYRGKGIGSKALELIKEKYKDNYIVLLASALDSKDKRAFMIEDKESIYGILKRLDCFYKKSGFKNKDSIYYIN